MDMAGLTQFAPIIDSKPFRRSRAIQMLLGRSLLFPPCYYVRSQENGVIISEPFGVYGAQTYRLYNELSLDQGNILGDYDVYVNIWTWPDEGNTNWNVTVRVAGEIVQEVTGIYSRTQGSSPDSFKYTLESYSSIEDC